MKMLGKMKHLQNLRKHRLIHTQTHTSPPLHGSTFCQFNRRKNMKHPIYLHVIAFKIDLRQMRFDNIVSNSLFNTLSAENVLLAKKWKLNASSKLWATLATLSNTPTNNSLTFDFSHEKCRRLASGEK